MRHRRMLAPINSVKHYINVENASLANNARRTIVLVDAAPAPATSSTDQVKEGSLVKAIFIEFWLKSNAASGSEVKFQYAIEKVPTGADSLTFTQLNNMQSYDNKKNVLFYSQGVLGDLTTGSIPVVRQWFKIPKGKQRFGLGDKLVMSIGGTGATINNCGFATYKEYT